MDKNFVRKPAVAGQFYPAEAISITEELTSYLPQSIDKKDAIACMLPHAGYKYSGAVALQTAAQINVKDCVILLGPNHTGHGAAYSLMSAGTWQTPMGNVEIDEDLAKAILERSQYLEPDSLAHMREHSLEVELPILQYFRRDFKIVPIAFAVDELDLLIDIGKAIAKAVKDKNRQNSTLLVASSDMTHYESAVNARKKDDLALAQILALDEKGLWNTVKSKGISMCGYMPVVAMIAAAKQLGASKAELVKYATSGDVTGDNSSVVGYAGIIVT